MSGRTFKLGTAGVTAGTVASEETVYTPHVLF